MGGEAQEWKHLGRATESYRVSGILDSKAP